MAYFDNAATTYPKPEVVYKTISDFYRHLGGGAGRGESSFSMSASAIIEDTREKIKSLLRCESKEVIFTPTATIALNIVIQGLIKKGVRNIYISPFEHNAVTRVIHSLESEYDLQVNILTVDKELSYDFERIRYQFDAIKPELVIISHASNVCGLVSPVEELFNLSKKYDAINVLDMAQTAGLVDINVGLSTIDFAVFDGHKTLYSPTGVGGFAMEPSIDLPPVLYGGTGYDSKNQNMPNDVPQKYEMGTMNTLGIAGLNASIGWLMDIGTDNIRAKEFENRKKLLEILSDYDFIKIIGNNEKNDYVGIVSCLIDGISSDSAASIFNRCDIAVRTGLQCAPLTHKFLGTYPAGTIRFSVGWFTSSDDFDELVSALDYIDEGL